MQLQPKPNHRKDGAHLHIDDLPTSVRFCSLPVGEYSNISDDADEGGVVLDTTHFNDDEAIDVRLTVVPRTSTELTDGANTTFANTAFIEELLEPEWGFERPKRRSRRGRRRKPKPPKEE